MADATKIQLGPCSIIVNGVNVGHTIGGAIFSYAPTFHDTVVDEYGKTVVEKFLLGEKITVETELAEFTYANLKAAMPFGAQSGNKITLGSIAGKRGTDHAQVVTIHPLEKATGDKTGDVSMYRAVASATVAVGYKADGERIIKVLFEGLVDETRSDGNLIGLIGDSTS